MNPRLRNRRFLLRATAATAMLVAACSDGVSPGNGSSQTTNDGGSPTPPAESSSSTRVYGVVPMSSGGSGTILAGSVAQPPDGPTGSGSTSVSGSSAAPVDASPPPDDAPNIIIGSTPGSPPDAGPVVTGVVAMHMDASPDAHHHVYGVTVKPVDASDQ